MTGHQFREIAGHEGSYQVNQLGQIKSPDRVIVGGHGTRRIRGQARKPILTRPQWICLHNGGRRTYHRISDLVAAAFGDNT